MQIIIKQYPVFMKLGVFKEERIMGQEVLVSIKVHVEMEHLSAMKDDLSKTLDYGKLIAALDEFLEDKQFKLVETALETVGQGLLKTFSQISQLEVHIEKPLLPRGLGKGSKVSIAHSFKR